MTVVVLLLQRMRVHSHLGPRAHSRPQSPSVSYVLYGKEKCSGKSSNEKSSLIFSLYKRYNFSNFSTYAIFNVAWKQALRLSASVKTFLRLQENLRHWAAQACERSQHKGSNAGKPLPHSFQVFPRAEKCVSCSAINEDLLPSCVKRLSNIKTKPGFLSLSYGKGLLIEVWVKETRMEEKGNKVSVVFALP